MAEEILRMTNITKRFAGITALDRVEFSCNKGEVHILAGENGAGKSTILKILAGIHQADEVTEQQPAWNCPIPVCMQEPI